MMKKKNNNYFWIIYLGIALLLISIILSFSSTYTREGYVENNNGVEILFCDSSGNLWAWEIETMKEFNEYKKGDKVILTFDINKTEDIVTDDILIKFRKMKKTIDK